MNYPSKRSLLAAALALGLNFVPGLTVLAAGVIGATILFKKQRETGRSRHGRPGLTHRLSGAVFPTRSAPLRSLFGTGAPHPLNRSRTGARILSSTFSPQGMTPGQRTPRVSPSSNGAPTTVMSARSVILPGRTEQALPIPGGQGGDSAGFPAENSGEGVQRDQQIGRVVERAAVLEIR